MIYIFEIYDRSSQQWYVDYTTKDVKIAEEYFNILMKTYNNGDIKVITRLDI